MSGLEKVTAVVFIKKNSERLPGKNLLPFNGRPLFTVVLQTLESHPYIDKILVNSDSDVVLDYVKTSLSKGVAINRPIHLLHQNTGANDLITHDIQFSNEEHFIQTHCTNPLLTADTISKAIEKYFELLPNHDSLFSVTKVQNRLYKEGGVPFNHDKSKLLRLQDMEPLYMENAAFFIFSRTSFAKAGNNRIGLSPFLYPVSTIECVDIDYKENFLQAEILERNKAAFTDVFPAG